MQIPPNSPHSASSPIPEPVNIQNLKRELKLNIDKMKHLLDEALSQPGHIQHTLCHDLAETVKQLHALAEKGSSLSRDKSDLAQKIYEASSLVNHFLQVPLHV